MLTEISAAGAAEIDNGGQSSARSGCGGLVEGDNEARLYSTSIGAIGVDAVRMGQDANVTGEALADALQAADEAGSDFITDFLAGMDVILFQDEFVGGGLAQISAQNQTLAVRESEHTLTSEPETPIPVGDVSLEELSADCFIFLDAPPCLLGGGAVEDGAPLLGGGGLDTSACDLGADMFLFIPSDSLEAPADPGQELLGRPNPDFYDWGDAVGDVGWGQAAEDATIHDRMLEIASDNMLASDISQDVFF